MGFLTQYIVRLDLNCDLTNRRKLLTVARLKSWPQLHKIHRTYLKGHHNIDLVEYLVTDYNVAERPLLLLTVLLQQLRVLTANQETFFTHRILLSGSLPISELVRRRRHEFPHQLLRHSSSYYVLHVQQNFECHAWNEFVKSFA